MININTYLWIIALVAFSCDSSSDKAQSDNNGDAHEWSYQGETGPEHWSALEKKSDCGGQSQSPINIIDIDAVEDASLDPIEIHYAKNVHIHNVTNNGHSIQYDFEEGDYIVVNDKQYNLKQIHFHEPSEHIINGIRFPLEIHMVHVSSDKKIAVLAIMAQEGQSSEPFTFLEKYLPVHKGETKKIDAKFDLNLNLPEHKEYYVYDGSLTTPPCTQGVLWHVFKNPITVSLDQVKQLQKLMPHNNYREEQPIHQRKVRKMSPQQIK